jgi:hypothetical protein
MRDVLYAVPSTSPPQIPHLTRSQTITTTRLCNGSALLNQNQAPAYESVVTSQDLLMIHAYIEREMICDREFLKIPILLDIPQ